MILLSALLRLDQHVEKEIAKQVENREIKDEQQHSTFTLSNLLRNRTFIYGCLASTMSWVCMNFPMSLVGVAMEDMLLDDKYTVMAFTAHFMGMFLPGFGTSRLIEMFGFTCVSLLSVASFSLSTVLNLLAEGDSASLWIVGQFFTGLGWNLGFSAATVMVSTCCPPEDRKNATVVQAYNDFISFFFGGIITISTGYIYESRGGGIDGWRFLNYILILFIGIHLVNVLAAWFNSTSHEIDNCDTNVSCAIETGAEDCPEPIWRRSSIANRRRSSFLEYKANKKHERGVDYL